VTAIECLITLGLSAAPVSELRGGLPYALSRGMPPAAAYFLAVGGNLVVVPLILLGLGRLERLAARWRGSAWLVEKVFSRTRRKGRLIERFGAAGLILLVAIPLPGTGAWTGAIAAWLLGMRMRRSLLLIAFGILVAGLVVLFASLGAFRLFSLA
jgi:uncharacterized membrane protein